MKCNYKRCVGVFGLAAACAVLAGCSGGGSRGGGSDAQANLAANSSGPLVTKAETGADASRFLAQTTFGPTTAEIDRVMAVQLDAWLAGEFAKPQSYTHLGYWQERVAASGSPTTTNTDWIYQSFWRSALLADDVLRQRIAFALSQIFVVSLNDMNVSQHPRGVASYFDVLGRNAFGNFRTLLEEVTLHPMMGLYLSHLRNRGDNSRVPDENYAREVMQLFTIGVHLLNPDGTRVIGADGRPAETYTNEDVTGIANVFTGWSWAGPDTESSRFNGGGSPAYPDRAIEPMQPYAQYHSEAAKTFLGGICPAGTMPRATLSCALDRLFMHQNVGPFIGRQLIQRLVSSNPSAAYVGRVAAAFADNGQGVRGDMKAVLRQILLDPEARNLPSDSDTAYGKVREPLLRMTALMRAANATSTSGQFQIHNTDDPGTSLGQTAMRSPSVFNFWRPGYTPPNSELAAGGLVAPELQAANESSVAGYLNAVQSAIQNGFGNSNDVKLDLTELQALAGDVDLLLARVELLLTSGKYRPETRTRIRDVVGSVVVPAVGETGIANARRDRARLALFLTVASPEFLAQK
ncbi:MAG: DUF1800 domain-containing protein [Lautropia sp.]|nr:DUF1800 domain-containing protein [Lautropia sp.]